MKPVSDWSISAITAHLKTLSDADQAVFMANLVSDSRKGVQQLCAKWVRQQQRQQLETQRLARLWRYEDAYRAKGHTRIAGTDEAGRGPLAGPVVAAAVILPREVHLPGINDSKKLSAEKRVALDVEIRAQAIAFAVCHVDAEQIDRWNILRAAEIAMAKALAEVGNVSIALVDGTNHPPIEVPQENIISGDSQSISIAAASILAKVWRDRHMVALDERYPGYGFADHKGYGTAAHYTALAELGPSPVHRRSFRLI